MKRARLRRAGFLAGLLIWLAALFAGGSELLAAGTSAPVASAVRISTEEDRTRFMVDLTVAVGFNVYVLKDPYRVIVDLPEVSFQLPADAGTTATGLLTSYRYGTMDRGKSRIVIDATGPVLIEKSFVVHAKEGEPARLVIDLVATDAKTFAKLDRSEQLSESGEEVPKELPPISATVDPSAQARAETEAPQRPGKHVPLPQPKPSPKSAEAAKTLSPKPIKRTGPRVVVIDPGHGGIDGGAVGAKGTLEKDVVLAFAQVLKRSLETSGRYKAVLTRSEDVFLSLRDRVRVAREHNADLLIALHADALRLSGTRGATIYTLSEKASDAEAEALAQKENRADIIAGVNLAAENGEVTGILIDLAQREAKNHSVFFAKHLTQELKPVTLMTRRPMRSAGFRVLKAPDVPSVLIELGYLSNKADETLMNTPAWRAKMASAVSAAIDRYFTTQLASGQ